MESTASERRTGYLVACASCHAQFDPTGVRAASFLCHCGARVGNSAPKAVDAPVRRCSACGAALAAGAEACAYCRSVVGAGAGRLVCPECFARNSGDARFCRSCGVEFRPQPVLSGGEPVSCPVCAIDLTPRSLASLAVQECERCRGLWVPATNFDALVEHAREGARERASDGLRADTPPQLTSGGRLAYRACPICRQPMHRKNFGRVSGVVIDWCRADGTWLDANELEQIATFVNRGGLDRKAAVEREEAQATAMRRFIERLGVQATTPPERESSFAALLTSLLT